MCWKILKVEENSTLADKVKRKPMLYRKYLSCAFCSVYIQYQTIFTTEI